jgi:hypothetical protein
MKLHHSIYRALLIAALYLLTAVVLNEFQQHHLVSAETAARLMGIMMGLLVLVSANAIPKRLVPLANLSCAPARDQTLRRIAAWTMVLGGLGFTLAYALAPITIARMLAMFLLAPAALVVVGLQARCAWRRRSTT